MNNVGVLECWGRVSAGPPKNRPTQEALGPKHVTRKSSKKCLSFSRAWKSACPFPGASVEKCLSFSCLSEKAWKSACPFPACPEKCPEKCLSFSCLSRGKVPVLFPGPLFLGKVPVLFLFSFGKVPVLFLCLFLCLFLVLFLLFFLLFPVFLFLPVFLLRVSGGQDGQGEPLATAHRLPRLSSAAASVESQPRISHDRPSYDWVSVPFVLGIPG